VKKELEFEDAKKSSTFTNFDQHLGIKDKKKSSDNKLNKSMSFFAKSAEQDLKLKDDWGEEIF